MNTYDYTNDGTRYRRGITPEETIATLKEQIAALEKTNLCMREALYAARSLLEDIGSKADALRGLDTTYCDALVSNALKASRASEELARAQEALRECKTF